MHKDFQQKMSLEPAIPESVTTKRHIERASQRVIEASPFTAYHLLHMRRKRADWVQTCATDGRDLFYNEAFVRSLPTSQLAYVLAHEAAHRMCAHHLRGRDLDHRIFGNAADYVVNGILDNMVAKIGDTHIQSPPHGLHDTSGRFTGMSSEQVYKILLKEADQDKNGQSQGQGQGQGQGDPNPGDQPWGGVMQSPDHQSDADVQRGMREIQSDNARAEQKAKQAGSEFSDPVMQAFKEAQPSKIDYREELDEMLASSLPIDQSFGKINRSMWMSGISYPGWVWQHGCGKIVVIIDQSGSIDYNKLAAFEADFQSLQEQLNPEEVCVIYVNTQVVGTETFLQGDTVKIKRKSGGGTHLDSAFEAIPEHMPDCEAVVCFTDLCVSPDDLKCNPGVPTLFVSTDYTHQPSFGKVIKLTMDHRNAA